MNIYIDGDNAPGTRTSNMAYFSEKDEIKLFYASNNKHYSNAVNREKLEKECNGNIRFVPVSPGKNSVDFAIAMHVAIDAVSGNIKDVVCIISGDKDFDVVIKQLEQMHPSLIFKRFENTKEAVLRYSFLNVDSLSDLHEVLQLYCGDIHGQETYNRIKELFWTQKEKQEARQGKSRIKRWIRKFHGLIR